MKALLLLSAVALVGAPAAAQDMGAFGPITLPDAGRIERTVNVFFDDTAEVASKELSEIIFNELKKSAYFNFVPSPASAARISAPTTLSVPVNSRGTMKVGFQMAFRRGNDMDFTVSCEVSKPQDCGSAIRQRAERLYREANQ